MEYTVVLEPQEEGGFTVQCVEIPGAISQGETREKALANIKETIELVLDVQREELYRKASTTRHEISKVDVADVTSAAGRFREKMVKCLPGTVSSRNGRPRPMLLCRKEWRVFSVSLHRELKKGTLVGILR